MINNNNNKKFYYFKLNYGKEFNYYSVKIIPML